MKDLQILLDEVHDAESFLAFVEALINDRYDEVKKANPDNPSGSGVGGWQNETIESYLEAANAWARDTHFGTKSEEQNAWKLFAQFLCAGKTYE